MALSAPARGMSAPFRWVRNRATRATTSGVCGFSRFSTLSAVSRSFRFGWHDCCQGESATDLWHGLCPGNSPIVRLRAGMNLSQRIRLSGIHPTERTTERRVTNRIRWRIRRSTEHPRTELKLSRWATFAPFKRSVRETHATKRRLLYWIQTILLTARIRWRIRLRVHSTETKKP